MAGYLHAATTGRSCMYSLGWARTFGYRKSACVADARTGEGSGLTRCEAFDVKVVNAARGHDCAARLQAVEADAAIDGGRVVAPLMEVAMRGEPVELTQL